MASPAQTATQPPNGNYYKATSLAQAQSWAAAVDQPQGYPAAGVEVGGGVHVQDPGGGPFRTQTYAPIIAHPNGTQWAYPSDAVTDPVVAPLAVGITPAPLDTTWVGGTLPAAPLFTRRRVLAAAAVTMAAAGTAAALSLLPAPSPQPGCVLEVGCLDAGADGGSQ